MTTLSGILAWTVPWAEAPGGLQGHGAATELAQVYIPNFAHSHFRLRASKLELLLITPKPVPSWHWWTCLTAGQGPGSAYTWIFLLSTEHELQDPQSLDLDPALPSCVLRFRILHNQLSYHSAWELRVAVLPPSSPSPDL